MQCKGLKVLSAAELKKDFFMSFEYCFRPQIWALGGRGSLPSMPVAFLDIRLDDHDLFRAGKNFYTDCLESLAVWNHQSTIRPFLYFPVPDVTMPF